MFVRFLRLIRGLCGRGDHSFVTWVAGAIRSSCSELSGLKSPRMCALYRLNCIPHAPPLALETVRWRGVKLCHHITHLALSVWVLVSNKFLLIFPMQYPSPSLMPSSKLNSSSYSWWTKVRMQGNLLQKPLRTFVISQSGCWKDQRTHLQMDRQPSPQPFPQLSQHWQEVRFHDNQPSTHPSHRSVAVPSLTSYTARSMPA